MSKLSEQQILSRARANSLENVKNLNFWGSDLNDISVLRQMPNVEVLSLRYLRGREIYSLLLSLTVSYKGPRLRELYLRKNSIQDISEIGCLKNLPKLRVLWLSDNPCANAEMYRMTVLKNLPKLTKLDTIVVEEAEVLEATKEGKEIPTPADTPVHYDFTATADKTNLKTDITRDDNLQAPEETDNPESTSHNLVNETNKLRAQLGLKPLLLEDQSNTTTAMTTTNVQKKAGETSSNRRSQNILSAVLTLVQELDHTSLLTVRKEIDQQLQDLDQMDSDSQDRDENGEEKEAIAD